ncbi:MAG: hypothetical protein J6J42_07195 [Lachnospiraceae bacterium]|nr:hypothetical protein [Lachnospiraceae bacterium]
MFWLSVKSIFNNKSRFLCTVVGFFAATVILVFGVYYLYVSNAIANESFETTLAEQRVLLNEVLVSGVDYYETDEGFVGKSNPITQTMILDILSSGGAESVCALYERQQAFNAVIDGREMVIDMPVAADPAYDMFSMALVNSLKEQEADFCPIVAGERLAKENPFTVLISEATVRILGLSNEDVIGKQMTVSGNNGKEYVVTVNGVYSHELSGYYKIELSEFAYFNGPEEPLFIGVEFLFHKDFFKLLNSDENMEEPLYPSYLFVSFDSTDDIQKFIEKMYVKYGLNTVSDYMRFFSDIEQRTKQAELFIAMGGVIFLLSVFMNFNTMLINISQQKRFIKMLRLLGFTRMRIYAIHTLQSMIYGIAGSVSGFLTAYVICAVIGAVTLSSFDEVMIKSDVFMLPVQYALAIVGLTVALNVFSGFLISVVQVNGKSEKRKK